MPIRQALSDPSHPRVSNTGQARLYGSGIDAVKAEGTVHSRCRHRPTQYLNNILEQDHRAIIRRVKANHGVGLQALFRGNYGWKIPDGPDYTITVGPSKPLNVEKAYRADSEKYQGPASLKQVDSGGYDIVNWQAGQAFVDPASRFVEEHIVGPAIERSEALVTLSRAAAAIADAVCAGPVPRHSNEETP